MVALKNQLGGRYSEAEIRLYIYTSVALINRTTFFDIRAFCVTYTRCIFAYPDNFMLKSLIFQEESVPVATLGCLLDTEGAKG